MVHCPNVKCTPERLVPFQPERVHCSKHSKNDPYNYKPKGGTSFNSKLFWKLCVFSSLILASVGMKDPCKDGESKALLGTASKNKSKKPDLWTSWCGKRHKKWYHFLTWTRRILSWGGVLGIIVCAIFGNALAMKLCIGISSFGFLIMPLFFPLIGNYQTLGDGGLVCSFWKQFGKLCIYSLVNTCLQVFWPLQILFALILKIFGRGDIHVALRFTEIASRKASGLYVPTSQYNSTDKVGAIKFGEFFGWKKKTQVSQQLENHYQPVSTNEILDFKCKCCKEDRHGDASSRIAQHDICLPCWSSIAKKVMKCKYRTQNLEAKEKGGEARETCKDIFLKSGNPKDPSFCANCRASRRRLSSLNAIRHAIERQRLQKF